MLSMPSSETGPFRGVVEKLLIHKNFRNRGGARALINALEAEAVKQGRTTLVSPSQTGLPRLETLTEAGIRCWTPKQAAPLKPYIRNSVMSKLVRSPSTA